MAAKTKNINLALIPPVPTLRLALVGKVDDRESEMVARLGLNSGQKLATLAGVARDLSLKNCFFCGKDSHPNMKKAADIDWKLMPLCACLADIRTGYREYYPKWQQQIEMITGKVQAGDLSENTPIYGDTCSEKDCGKPFIITAGKIARAVQKWGKHERAHRCKGCVDRTRAAKQSQRLPQQVGETPVKKAHRHQKNRRPTQLTATMGEQLAVKHPEQAAAQG